MDLTSAQEEEAADRLLDAQVDEYLEREYRIKRGLFRFPVDWDVEPPEEETP